MANTEYFWAVGGTKSFAYEKLLGNGGHATVHQVEPFYIFSHALSRAQIRDDGIPSVYTVRVFARKIVVKGLCLEASENEQRAIQKRAMRKMRT